MARGKNKYLVRSSGKEITVYADRVGHGNGLYFWVENPDSNNDLVAHFPYGYSFTLVDEVTRPAPVPGVDYYTVEELKTAVRQTQSILGDYYAEQIDKAALQARKNRVFDAHTR